MKASEESDTYLACCIVGDYVKTYGFSGNWAEDIDCALHDAGISTVDSSDLHDVSYAAPYALVRLKNGAVITWDPKWRIAESRPSKHSHKDKP